MDPKRHVFADRSERGKLELTGPQRAWFLHQILTQAFEDMSAGDARDTALITAHGRMVGYMETLATDDAILMHYEPELAGTLPDALRRYVFATQVDVADVTVDYGLVLLVAPNWQEVAAEIAPTPRLIARCRSAFPPVTCGRRRMTSKEFRRISRAGVSSRQAKTSSRSCASNAGWRAGAAT